MSIYELARQMWKSLLDQNVIFPSNFWVDFFGETGSHLSTEEIVGGTLCLEDKEPFRDYTFRVFGTRGDKKNWWRRTSVSLMDNNPAYIIKSEGG